MGIRDFCPGKYSQGAKLDIHVCVLLKLKMSGVIPLLPMRLNGVYRNRLLRFSLLSDIKNLMMGTQSVVETFVNLDYV